MIYMPNTPRSFLDILTMSIRHHFAVLRKTIGFIVLIVIVKDLYIYLGGMPEHPFAMYLIGIVMSVLLIYLFMAMFYMTNRVLRSEYCRFSEVFPAINRQLIPLYLASLVFVLVPVILLLLSAAIMHFILDAHRYTYATLIFIFVVGIPMMIFYLRYFYTLPFIVIQELPMWEAFLAAAKLARKNWGRVFGVYLCVIAVWLLVSPDTLHGHFMKAYRISAIFDFIVFCVTLPIVMNLIIFMWNDLRLRQGL